MANVEEEATEGMKLPDTMLTTRTQTRGHDTTRSLPLVDLKSIPDPVSNVIR